MKHYVVVNKSTREILACISEKQIVLRKDVDVKTYDGTEPVLRETDHGIYLKDNAVVIKL